MSRGLPAKPLASGPQGEADRLRPKRPAAARQPPARPPREDATRSERQASRTAPCPAVAVAATSWRLLRRSWPREHGRARRRQAGRDAFDLLAWGRKYLPRHFTPAALAHAPLAGRGGWTCMRTQRGMKLNVLAPRGGAKSTIGTLAFPLRAALEGWEPYIWIVSDTRHQACAHLENIKAELLDNAALAADYPAGGRPRAGVAGRGHRAPQRRGHRGLRHRPAAPRPPAPRSIAPR